MTYADPSLVETVADRTVVTGKTEQSAQLCSESIASRAELLQQHCTILVVNAFTPFYMM